MGHSTTNINVSLETHLLDILNPLLPLLPQELADGLARYVTTPTIPYNTLLAISQWSRTEAARTALQSASLHFQDYSMISLLAGATTSPEGKFGYYVAPKEPEELAADQVRERKAITALLNALLSIGGVAFATWWAADKMGWKNEWRVLFALFAAVVVAISEAGLYLIWQARRSKSKRPRLNNGSARHKKVDPEVEPPLSLPPDPLKHLGAANEPDDDASILRQRK